MKLSIKKILVPTDFSEISYAALEYAAFVAKSFGAKITLLHVYEHFDSNAHQVITNYTELIEEGIRKKMDDIKNDNTNLWGVKIETKIVNGKTYREIESAVKELGIDLVVMGTHGAQSVVKSLEKYFLGTNAYRTVHESSCPVLTVRKRGKKLECGNILLPLDLTKESGQKTDFAIEWAKTFKSKVHLLAVTELLDEFISDVNRLSELVKKTENRLINENIPYTVKMYRNANVSKTVMSHAKKMACDLILIMSQKDSTFGEFLVPAADRKVIGESEINVLSLRPKA